MPITKIRAREYCRNAQLPPLPEGQPVTVVHAAKGTLRIFIFLNDFYEIYIHTENSSNTNKLTVIRQNILSYIKYANILNNVEINQSTSLNYKN